MITFLDENDVEYGVLATIKATNAVNGERSLTGTIVSGDYVLSNIERGWRLRFDDEYFVVTYAKPIDEGRDVQVEFDAVHQFFWDFDKSSVYDQLTDGSHTFVAYLDFIFKNSGYSYTVDSALNVHAFEKQSFGFKKRLSLFNDIITSTGVEFQVNGKVVRILEKVGTDLSTVVRKNFNMNELTIEKNIGDFVTYQKGFGAYFDEEDHSKGRLEVEYTSPLASVYGKLEAEPFVDERYTQSSSLLAALKENVDNSYTISVALGMEDLTRAGYKYKQPVAGDYIMAINETLDFQEKIRIVSFTSEYDVQGILVKHEVTCNDIGSVKKLSASYTHTQHQAANAEANANTAYEFANKALISADGKNTNYYGDSFPVDNPKGTLKKGDLLFLTLGDKVKQYYWNGADWIINPVLDDVEAFKEQIADELKDVPNREEFENKIAEELATSKAEIETQIESAKTQAESNAKEYADTINQETAKVAEQANAASEEIKADLVNVKNNLTSTSLVANNAQAAVDAAKQELTEVANELSTAKQDLTNSVAEVNTKVDGAKAELTQAKQQLTTVADDLSTAKQDFQNAVSAVDTKATNLKNDLSQAKQDLASQAQQLQEQAGAQSELSNRVSSVEKTANGTKTTVSELSKTVAQNGKDITSVTARTKVVEDDLAGTKTTLSQVQTTANSTSQKTATLETGLDGLNAKFSNLKIGGANLLLYSADPSKAPSGYYDFTGAQKTSETYNGSVVYKARGIWNGIRVNLGNLAERGLLKVGDVLTYSVAMRAEQETPIQARLFIRYTNQSEAVSPTGKIEIVNLTANWQYVSVTFTVTAKMLAENTKVTFLGWELTSNAESGKYVYYACNKIERGNVATDYTPNESDLEQKVAEYKQNADQNYASLQTTVQNLDGTVQHNKTIADQTAQGFSTRIESLETYKDGESERANAYFESAKTETAKQLTAERTAIAKDYVAKSTYTSDVTGIRNELSATTSTANATKTNLANYQASNDKMVASLKSSLQTTDGNVSNLQTKVEAVPGQITSAVSAVEGKIPTSVGSTNLLLYSADPSKAPSGYYDFTGAQKTSETYNGSVVYKARGIWNGIRVNLGNLAERGLLKVGDVLTYSVAMRAEQETPIQARLFIRYTNQSEAVSPTGKIEIVNLTANWQYVSVTFTVTAKMLAENTKVTYLGWELTSNAESGKYVYYACNKLERGNVATDYSPAPEDATNQISNLSSEIKQTADGMTLLATKTELNSAKSELQSGISTATSKADNAQSTANSNAQTISTHTTQISALNTGLQAKVSQSDFNTLSGRVTTAENNIIAKANELSSKITTVEGAIEDTQSDITKLSSEIKQTADGMTLLATKTELNIAKSDLQSGINTATNKANTAQSTADSAVTKANAAQNKANSNAQTISTHTTQISALNTGLQAKVSQTEFNTLSGRVTSAENNITAKANELSSKITTVEGKIPTNVSTRNLILKSNDFANPHKHGGANTTVTSTNGYFVIKSTGYTSNSWGGMSWNMSISEVKAGEEFSILMPVYIDSSIPLDSTFGFNIKNHTSNTAVYGYDIPTNKKDQWFNVAITFKAYKNVVFDGHPFYVYLAKNGLVRIKPPMLVRGNLIPSDWQPAPEDTISQISSLSSELKQTKDGITLLATKTELNNAKNELQSGINTATNKANSNAQTISTHTTQISALNTGLSAKVSQSDFNTLSGRVTNAENNITAKANELSSKITSVEGKIPTSVGGRNLLSKTNQGKTNWGWNISSGGVTIEDFETYGVNAVKMTRTSDASVSWSYIYYDGLIRKLIEPDTKYTLSFDVYPTENVTFTATLMRNDAVGEYTDWAVMNTALANRWTKVSCVLTSKTTLPDDLGQGVYLQGMPTAAWNWLVIKNIKLEEGVVSSDWSPAPEDTISQISSLSSEFKQTTDAIKASVSSLDNSTVKSSSLTINADGIVMKAGKSTTDVANAIGSYFAVNQNAINLFSDKINVKGNMIVSGAITSDKIASKSINTAHLNGKIITADVISSNAVTANAIKAGAVTTDKMSANSINGDRIAAGTLDAAKIKAGSITASQIASGTITSNQIKTGGISSANIAAGAITTDKIAAGAIDANKIAANALTANMIKGGQLNSTNGATVFDLNAGTLTFNNNYGYIQRVASDKVFEITTWLHNADASSQEYLTSAFKIRKSDFSRLAGAEFTLYNATEDKPTALAKINADTLILSDSKNTTLFSMYAKGAFGNVNFQGWGDIPVASLYNSGLLVKDIGIGGHTKSLLNIVEELCKKAGIIWV